MAKLVMTIKNDARDPDIINVQANGSMSLNGVLYGAEALLMAAERIAQHGAAQGDTRDFAALAQLPKAKQHVTALCEIFRAETVTKTFKASVDGKELAPTQEAGNG